MSKIIKFLDNHRLILILLILLVVSITFISIKSVIFLNHNFKKLECTNKKDEVYCYHDEKEIYINPEKEKEKIFQEKKVEINNLKKKYKNLTIRLK